MRHVVRKLPCETIGIADAPTTTVAGLGEDERMMGRLSWHGGLLK
jgi:hypothetical protein